MARLVSRRRLVYYTIVVTSVCWILGTVSFFLIQSLEVNIEVKRRTPGEIVPLQIPKLNAHHDQSAKETDKRGDQHDKPSEAKKSNQPVIRTSYNKDASTAKNSPKKTVFITANYERFPPGAKLKGPGTGGEGVTVPASRKHEEDKGFDQHSFNRVASDMISFHRKLRDNRNKG